MPTSALANQSYISLETFKKDGSGVKTPVWCAPLEDRIAVFTDGTSYKVKRLRRDSRVRVAACDVRGGVRGAWVEGTCTIATESREIDAAYAALRQKYGWQMWITDFLSRLSGRISRRAVLIIRLDPAEPPATADPADTG